MLSIIHLFIHIFIHVFIYLLMHLFVYVFIYNMGRKNLIYLTQLINRS